jgi:hypothetical protein
MRLQRTPPFKEFLDSVKDFFFNFLSWVKKSLTPHQSSFYEPRYEIVPFLLSRYCSSHFCIVWTVVPSCYCVCHFFRMDWFFKHDVDDHIFERLSTNLNTNWNTNLNITLYQTSIYLCIFSLMQHTKFVLEKQR